MSRPFLKSHVDEYVRYARCWTTIRLFSKGASPITFRDCEEQIAEEELVLILRVLVNVEMLVTLSLCAISNSS